MSDLAELISEAIDSTSNHVEVIDRIIAEHGDLVSSTSPPADDSQPVPAAETALNDDDWRAIQDETGADLIDIVMDVVNNRVSSGRTMERIADQCEAAFRRGLSRAPSVSPQPITPTPELEGDELQIDWFNPVSLLEAALRRNLQVGCDCPTQETHGYCEGECVGGQVSRLIFRARKLLMREAVPPAIAGDEEAIVRHPEDYCHKCGGPNISWYAPSLLWNQFVRDKGEPEIICPICFAQLASEANVTWSMVPDTVTSDYDERLAVRAAQRIINATIQSEEEAMVIVRDALVQSAEALRSRQASQPVGSRLRPECKAQRCFYEDAHECQTDQGWHGYVYKDGVQFPAPCDCPCHKNKVEASSQPRPADKGEQ